MAENSKIEWTTHTMNFWIGCQEVSPACDLCYARDQNEFRKWVSGWGPHGERRRTSAGNWHKLRKWNREAGERGVRDKVFSNSLSDFFDNHGAARVARREAWHYIEQSPNLDFLLLTKRPQNIPGMLPDPDTGVKPWGDGWPNVWLGTTVENQEEANRRIPHLIEVPARIKFLSCEPLLGPIQFKDVPGFNRIGLSLWNWWVIAGGESDAKGQRRARPMHPDWARSLRDQCVNAGVPFFFKQWGDFYPADQMTLGNEAADAAVIRVDLGSAIRSGAAMELDNQWTYRIGKKLAGALFDGREHKAMPNA